MAATSGVAPAAHVAPAAAAAAAAAPGTTAPSLLPQPPHPLLPMEAPAVAGVSAAEGGQHGVGLAAFCWQTWQEELQAGACPVPLHEWWVALDDRCADVLQAAPPAVAALAAAVSKQGTNEMYDDHLLMLCRLHSLRLSHLLPLFHKHEVDEVALPLMEESDYLVGGDTAATCFQPGV
eukprot:1158357-Pelagomonas_calceolata.AAC.3